MERESMREVNIRRIMLQMREGGSLADLTDRERVDICWLDGVNLTSFKDRSDGSPIVGSLTVGEVRRAQNISKALRNRAANLR